MRMPSLWQRLLLSAAGAEQGGATVAAIAQRRVVIDLPR